MAGVNSEPSWRCPPAGPQAVERAAAQAAGATMALVEGRHLLAGMTGY